MKLSKKLTIGVLSSVLAFSATVTVGASQQTNDVLQIENKDMFLYKYSYKGIDFEGTTELTTEQLEGLYQQLLNKGNGTVGLNGIYSTISDRNGISPLSLDSGLAGATRVTEQYFRTYTNDKSREAANLIVAKLATKLPLKISKTTLGNYVFNKLTGWATAAFAPTYVGSWISRHYDSNSKMYIYHATLIHYTDSSFSKVKTVQYWEVNRSTSPNLASY